jgi:hypothetical protein
MEVRKKFWARELNRVVASISMVRNCEAAAIGTDAERSLEQ